MQDLVRDWRRWTVGERVLAVVMVVALLLSPAVLTVLGPIIGP